VCPASCPSSCKTCYYCANEGSCAKEDPQAPWTKAQCDAVTKSGVDAMWCGSDTPDPEECTCPEECPSGSKGSCYFCEQKMCTDWPVTQCVSTPNTKWCGPPGPPAPPAPPALECKQTCPFWDGKEGGFDWENLDLPPKLCPQPILKPELTPLQKALLPGGVGGPEIGYSFDPATSPFEPWKADVCNHDFASIVHGGPAACLGPGCTASANCSSWDGTGAIPKINGCTGQSNTLPDTAPSFASYYDIVEAWGVGAYDREMAGFMAIIASGEASPSNHEASNPKCNGLPCTLYDATDPNGIWQMTGLSALSFFDICKIDPSKIPKGTFPDDSTPSAYAYAVMNNPCCTARLASYWVQNYDPDNHQCMTKKKYIDMAVWGSPGQYQCSIPAPLTIGNTVEWATKTSLGASISHGPNKGLLNSANSINFFGSVCHISGTRSAANRKLPIEPPDRCDPNQSRYYNQSWVDAGNKYSGVSWWWGGGQAKTGQGLMFPHYYANTFNVRQGSGVAVKQCAEWAGYSDEYCQQVYRQLCGSPNGDMIICYALMTVKKYIPTGWSTKKLDAAIAAGSCEQYTKLPYRKWGSWLNSDAVL